MKKVKPIATSHARTHTHRRHFNVISVASISYIYIYIYQFGIYTLKNEISAQNTVKLAYNRTASERIFFLCEEVSFNAGTLTMDHQDSSSTKLKSFSAKGRVLLCLGSV